VNSTNLTMFKEAEGARSAPITPAALTGDELGQVESHGVDIIPAEARHSKPRDVFYVFLGSQMSFGIIVIGALPVTFGLSFRASISAVTVGLALGSAVFGLLAMLGAKTGTNGPVASVAHFGVQGKAIGTVLGVLVTLGFFALTAWTGGQAVVAAGERVLGWHNTPHLMFAWASVIGAITTLAAVYGHSLIVATETFVSYAIGAVLLLAVAVLWPSFHADYAGSGTYAAGSFWPTWLLASSICAALPISYATILNDYTRYLPESTEPARSTWAAGGGMFIGCWLAIAFAVYVTTLFKSADTPFVSGLIGLCPSWLVVVFALVGVVGSQPQGSLCLYSGGLGMQSMVPSVSRVPFTVAQSVAGGALVWAGIYLADMTSMLVDFLTLIECAVSPWLTINIVGYFLIQRGRYKPHDLLKGSANADRGAYWYANGWNRIAVFAWAAGSVSGLLFVQTDMFSGPLFALTDGTNSAWLIAAVVGAAIYAILEKPRGEDRRAGRTGED
jgi:purine-cytosine permease-like protein